MDHSSIPNFNQIQLEYIPEFLAGIFEKVHNGNLVESINEDLNKFEIILVHHFKKDDVNRVTDLENLRNELFEIMLDRLDDHINIHIEDWFNDLDILHLTKKEALNGKDEYRASKAVLGKNDKDAPVFFTKLERSGHVWEESHYRNLLNRLESGDYQNDAEYLGIAERVVELIAIDHEQQKIIDEKDLEEELKELRQLRYSISRKLNILYSEIYTEKERKKELCLINAVELIIDNLNAENEKRELLKFSANDLSYDQFLTVLEKTDTISEEHKVLWEKKGRTTIQEFRKALIPFKRSAHWSEFEESEAILFRAVERFMMELPGNTLCADAVNYKYLWSKFEHSPRFQTAFELMEELSSNGLFIERAYHRGNSVHGKDIPLMLSLLQKPERKEKLVKLRLWPLFLEISESDCRSRELIAPVLKKYKCVELDELRDLRWRATKILRLMHVEQ